MYSCNCSISFLGVNSHFSVSRDTSTNYNFIFTYPIMILLNFISRYICNSELVTFLATCKFQKIVRKRSFQSVLVGCNTERVSEADKLAHSLVATSIDSFHKRNRQIVSDEYIVNFIEFSHNRSF